MREYYDRLDDRFLARYCRNMTVLNIFMMINGAINDYFRLIWIVIGIILYSSDWSFPTVGKHL